MNRLLRGLLVSGLSVFVGVALTSESFGQCVIIDTTDCDNVGEPPEPDCNENDCSESVFNPGNFICPGGSTGCEVADDTYDGYYFGSSGSNSWDFGAEVICVRCGDCEGCTLLGNNCRNDPDNWEEDEILYDLVGVGSCG